MPSKSEVSSVAAGRVPEIDVRPTVPALLASAASRFGDADFIVTADERLSFAEADRRSADMARVLLAGGIGKGARIGIVLPSGIDFTLAFLAATRIGAVTMLFSSTYRPAELARVARIADVDTLVVPATMLGREYRPHLESAFPGLAELDGGPIRLTSAPFLRTIRVVGEIDAPWATRFDLSGDSPEEKVPADLLAAVGEEVSPADLLLAIYTSGSSADPKAVLHTHGATIRKVHSSTGLGLQASRGGGLRILMAMPFFWVGGPQSILGCLHTGSCLISQERFEPDSALELVEREAASVLAGWPTMLDALRRHPAAEKYDLSSLDPAPGTPPVVAPISSKGHALNMGMTETFGIHRNRAYFDYKVVDPETGVSWPDGEEGEFCVRGFGLMAGLYKKEREEVFDADGYYHTGDRGYIEDGNIFFTGRISEMIKAGGANVSPLEVEAALMSLDGVLRAYVLGVEDPAQGEEVVAFVVPEEGAELIPDDLRSRVNQIISAFKVPGRIFVVADEEVPTLPSGKVDKRALRAGLGAP